MPGSVQGIKSRIVSDFSQYHKRIDINIYRTGYEPFMTGSGSSGVLGLRRTIEPLAYLLYSKDLNTFVFKTK